ncbi:hypothetical protein BL250_06275 [Erwinia sp. OLTSP20]|uniref:hypothetical protein n=1 Tax=unclassified Erwinia TaxID=2622719 RepID=UPI000C19BED2|nr:MULTISPECIES: hypothetical protein [unclassified Erwinia]PIJ51835.1 hypothetical protein BV501_02560 [Erwinia sp. OAMSP11]PIJ74423.1 hypothetical protein BK416_04490 [Erwinia sp. OLSSP12]PIJ83744.1 hypothetical protein BLD47_03635 [Erwinia sp. OLCASP19]PIJ86787.1 hypothetical protein BLD46_02130 [Erwinia sp. OLMTSP26]PIJ88194.1 hypothetical protein BLD49_02810 [Erwinia sp. OLMDSP33]
MSQSINAWLQQHIDEYKFRLRDLTVDFYMAQARLNRPECQLDQLRGFNDACMNMAELCQMNGDDDSYLHALGRLHQRLLTEVRNTQRDKLFRAQAWQLARHSLTRLCHQFAVNGEWQKASALQTEFVKYVW